MTAKQPLQKALHRCFSSRSLSQEQLRTLNAMADAHRTTAGFFGRHRIAALAVFVAAVAAVALFSIETQRGGLAADVYQRVAEEVVSNHLKLRPLDVNTDQFNVLRQFFTKLDFVPVSSVLLEGDSWKLVGGRYCSVQGREAAQLRMRSPAGHVRTLYEVPYNPERYAELPDVGQGEPPFEVYARGMKVHLWREKGLMFVSVSERDALQ